MKLFRKFQPLFWVRSLDEWLRLPVEKRTIFRFFYRPPGALSEQEWKRFDEYVKKNFKIHYFFRDTFFYISWGWKRYIKDPIYYLKCRFIKKYHIINLGPHYHWIDANFRIEKALEVILDDFITKENPWNTVNWETNTATAEIKRQIIQVHENFRIILPAKQKQYEELLEKYFGNNDFVFSDLDSLEYKLEYKKADEELTKIENEIENLITENLITIVKLRKYLWT